MFFVFYNKLRNNSKVTPGIPQLADTPTVKMLTGILTPVRKLVMLTATREHNPTIILTKARKTGFLFFPNFCITDKIISIATNIIIGI